MVAASYTAVASISSSFDTKCSLLSSSVELGLDCLWAHSDSVYTVRELLPRRECDSTTVCAWQGNSLHWREVCSTHTAHCDARRERQHSTHKETALGTAAAIQAKHISMIVYCCCNVQSPLHLWNDSSLLVATIGTHNTTHYCTLAYCILLYCLR